MIFSDLALSRRLERTEGRACASFAAARRHIQPGSGAEWIECGGAVAVFDGVGSPLTQTFGLGVYEDLTPAALDYFENFFGERGAAVHHEVSPLAGVAALDLLCQRGYRPIEVSSVMFRPVEEQAAELPLGIRVRIVKPEEADRWAETSARGWAAEHPELMEFLRELGTITFAAESALPFLAEIDGHAGAAGMMAIHDGVALFGGSATVPELRRRGLQGALLQARMRYAAEHGCDLAMMVAEPGSDSQRNAERKGFRIAYTRTKWRLHSQVG